MSFKVLDFKSYHREYSFFVDDFTKLCHSGRDPSKWKFSNTHLKEFCRSIHPAYVILTVKPSKGRQALRLPSLRLTI